MHRPSSPWLIMAIMVVMMLVGAAMGKAPPPPAADTSNPHGAWFGTIHCTSLCDVASTAKWWLDPKGHSSGNIVPLSDRIAARGWFNDTIEHTGWSTLIIETSGYHSPMDQAYASGYLEGCMTAQRIHMHITNLMEATYSGFPEEAPKGMLAWYTRQLEWTHEMIANNRNDSFWQSMALWVHQLDGMVKGYNEAKPKTASLITLAQLMLLQDAGGHEDVLRNLYPETRTNCWDRGTDSPMMMTAAQSSLPAQTRSRGGRCSVLIKPIMIDGRFDLAIAHNTWSDYRSMTRIMKTYRFAFSPLSLHRSSRSSDAWTLPDADDIPHHRYTMTFSSYPATINSIDDFYVLGESGLIVTETTNSICDAHQYDDIVTHALLTWQRNLIANFLATSGKLWTQIFIRHRNANYNNQFMIIDTSRWLAGGGSSISDTLWIVEQAPLMVRSLDVSDRLSMAGFWASYNRPFFDDIFQSMGYARAESSLGSFFAYDNDPRAAIFHRDQESVVDMAGMMAIMQYNNWHHDQLADNNPWNAISARGDLVPDGGRWVSEWIEKMLFGGIDTKITTVRSLIAGGGAIGSATEWSHTRIWAISGPTYTQQPPFDWSDNQWCNKSHLGLPNRWRFPWQTFDL